MHILCIGFGTPHTDTPPLVLNSRTLRTSQNQETVVADNGERKRRSHTHTHTEGEESGEERGENGERGTSQASDKPLAYV